MTSMVEKDNVAERTSVHSGVVSNRRTHKHLFCVLLPKALSGACAFYCLVCSAYNSHFISFV